jgi:hypothetical protein
MTKTWPADDTETVPFEDMMEPAIEAITAAYRLRPRRPREIAWTGLSIGPAEVDCNVDGLDANTLAHNRDVSSETGESYSDLRSILGQVIRVAIEQGRRLEIKFPSREHRQWCRRPSDPDSKDHA